MRLNCCKYIFIAICIFTMAYHATLDWHCHSEFTKFFSASKAQFKRDWWSIWSWATGEHHCAWHLTISKNFQIWIELTLYWLAICWFNLICRKVYDSLWEKKCRQSWDKLGLNDLDEHGSGWPAGRVGWQFKGRRPKWPNTGGKLSKMKIKQTWRPKFYQIIRKFPFY